jgi:collagenase-like PrtC family protease
MVAAIDLLKGMGIKCNYVCNSFYLTPDKIVSSQDAIKNFFGCLKDSGIDAVIVANPLLMKYTRLAGIKCIISTILHVDSLGVVKFYIDKGVDTIVLSLYANRDFRLLEAISKMDRRRTKIELMVNEICLTPCPWRVQHYIQESSCEDSGNVYFSRCYAKMFSEFPFSIICGNFIRPVDVEFYRTKYMIDTFKITGRTFDPPKMLNILYSYLVSYCQGNMVGLFPIVKGTYKSEKKSELGGMYIDNKLMGDFMRMFPKDVNCRTDCFRFGGVCDFCKRYALDNFKFLEGV